MRTAQGPAGGSSSSGSGVEAPGAVPGEEPMIEEPVAADLLIDERRRGVAARYVPRLMPVMAVLLGAWLSLSSAPLGGPGSRWAVWLAALAVPLIVLLWIAAGLMLSDARRYASGATRPVTAWAGVVCWICAVVLGLFLPDVVDGQPTSILLALAPSATPGLSWGFANTMGVLTFAAAAASILSAALDVRRTRRLRRGEVLTMDPDEEDRAREAWLASFQDPTHRAS